MNYGEAIRVAREKAGFSKRRLATLCEFNASYMGLIESGQRTPSLEALEKIAGAVGSTVVGLLGERTWQQERADVVAMFEANEAQCRKAANVAVAGSNAARMWQTQAQDARGWAIKVERGDHIQPPVPSIPQRDPAKEGR